MNPSKHRLWWAFWGGVVLVIAALSWASLSVYSLEERNAVSRAENQRQEVIRLALWRMDSRLAPMIAMEAARPIEDYETVLGLADRSGVASSSRDDEQSENEESLGTGVYAQGFFEIDETGAAKGSGQRAQELAFRTQSIAEDSVSERSDEAAGKEAQPSASGALMSPSAMTDSLQFESLRIDPEPRADYKARQEIANLAQNNVGSSKRTRSTNTFVVAPERAMQSEALHASGLTSDQLKDSQRKSDRALARSSDVDDRVLDQSPALVLVGAIEPRWVREADGTSELVLMRTIVRDGRSVVQGVWLDWDTMSSELIRSIDDLLPASTLNPIIDSSGTGNVARPSYRLATVPVAFIPGGAGYVVESDSFTPAMIAMLVTWGAVILAMIAVGLVLRTVLTLSARRGRFVGAVTHELRTPLTTFRLYSQMLADGMVTDETVRKEYLNTLKRESDRLTGIVENVLEYARISRQPNRQRDKPKGEQQLSVGELMARIVPPMSRLGEQSGMDLIVSDETTAHAERTVTLDPHAIERIVMNLMDNACKYAGADGDSGDDQDLRVHLDASVSDDSLLLVVADHGPGVHSRDRRKIFGEFVRGSSPSMSDRSGLGLGLALSRGLALEMGGDLSLVSRRGHGAEFELRIPLDTDPVIED